jgi:hypothetical protein
MKSTSASIPDLERMNGIRLEDDIAGRLKELQGRSEVKDFYYQPVLRYYREDVHPDFLVKVPRGYGLEFDVLEAKNWGKSKALILYSNNVDGLMCQGEDADEIITQMYKYDLGTMYEKALSTLKKGKLIIVTTAPLYIAKNGQPASETEVLRIPLTTRNMNSKMEPVLSKSTFYIVSFAYFKDNYPGLA